jgi:hypothetical protein
VRSATPKEGERDVPGLEPISVTMDIYGHLFPSEAEALATAMDEVFLAAQTDNRRTNAEMA